MKHNYWFDDHPLTTGNQWEFRFDRTNMIVNCDYVHNIVMHQFMSSIDMFTVILLPWILVYKEQDVFFELFFLYWRE